MIIDGTGDDYQKIAREKKELEEIGYRHLYDICQHYFRSST
jgi:hypothetical protein